MMVKKNLLVFNLLFGAIVFPLLAEERLASLQLQELSLEECINIALLHNPDMAKLRSGIEMAKSDTEIARADTKPGLNGALGSTHSIDNQSFIKPRQVGERIPYVDNIYSADLLLAVPLYTAGKLKNRVNSLELQAEATESSFERARRELIFNVSNLFYAMLGQKEVINSLVFSQTVLSSHTKRVSEFVMAKKAAKVDLLRTEVRLADIEQRLIREKNVLNIQRTMLLNIMGLDIVDSDTCLIAGSLATEPESPDLDTVLEQVLSLRKDYLSLQRRIEAQRMRLEIARAEKRPELYLKGAYGHRWADSLSEGNSEDVGQIGLSLDFPVFDGGRIKAGVNKEEEKLKQLQEELRQLRIKIQMELKVAKLNIDSIQARLSVIGKSLAQAEESLRIEKDKYDNGKGVIVDVLDAQTALLESQTSHFRALAELNIAMAQFKLAAGEKK
jgi:outer membrane protein TolC